MNDSNKRMSLKTLVATALATGLPAVAGATAGLTASGAPVVISEGASVAAGSAVNVVFGAGLSFTDAVQVTTPLATVGALNTVSTTRRVLT